MISFNHEALDCYCNNDQFTTLTKEFQRILAPQLSLEKIENFYRNESLKHIDAIFIKSGDKLAGFTSIAFYHQDTILGKLAIARIAVGVEPGNRGGALPLAMIWEKLIAYKKSVGEMPLYFVGYIANALVYNAICENMYHAYPRLNTDTPDEVTKLRDELKGANKAVTSFENDFTVRLPFQVNIDKDLQSVINNSPNENVKYFLKLNPRYMQQNVLMVIAPVTWENYVASIEMIAQRKAFRKAA